MLLQFARSSALASRVAVQAVQTAGPNGISKAFSGNCRLHSFRHIYPSRDYLVSHFSTQSNNESEPEHQEAASNTLLGRVLTPQIQTYLMIGGGAVGSVVIARTVLSFTSFFTHLTPMTMAKYGFYLGFGTAGALAGLATFTYDAVTIRADPVFRYGLAKVQADPNVMAALGDGIVPGKLRTYRLDSGRFEACSATKVVYRPPRIQMLFDVRGEGPPYRTGLCTLEAYKSTGSFPPQLKTTVLKLDYEDENEADEGDKTIWLVGDEDKYQRVSKRSGIRLSELGRFMHINKAVRN